MALYLIKRGPRPDIHRAPFHPVIICDLKPVAKWEAGNSGDGAWVWTAYGPGPNVGGWLLTRWNGFDVDYGPVVHGITMPDGSHAAFWRDYESQWCVKDLFPGAIWWSKKKMPDWLGERGVIYPPDTFSRQSILDAIANDGCSGVRREQPEFWPLPDETAGDPRWAI